MERKIVATYNAKEISFWNHPEIRFYAFISIMILLVVIYIYYWTPRQECSSSVQYNPANKLITEGYYTVGRHGSFMTDKFKTRGEAIRYCLSER